MKKKYNTNDNINKAITAVIVSLVVLLIFITAIFILPSINRNRPGDIVDNTTVVSDTTVPVTAVPAETVINTEVLPTGIPETAPTTAPAPAEETQTASDPSAWTTAEIVGYLSDAVNKTKSYTGALTVDHTEGISGGVTEVTGGSLVQSIANSLVSSFVKPTNETLQFSNGYAVNSENETVSILLPNNKPFSLTSDGVATASAARSGDNILINIQLVPESVDMNNVPTYNSQSIGYLDVAGLDISAFTITSANITYQGSVITATVRPDGYIAEATYAMPLTIHGSGKAALVNGEATFEGQQNESWVFNWQ